LDRRGRVHSIPWRPPVAGCPELRGKLIAAGGCSKRLALVSPRWLAALVEPNGNGHDHDTYDTRFYRQLRGWIAWCVLNRTKVIALTVLALVASIALFRFVPQQFFPSSTRLELVVT
jgi:multidrug efflux pump